MTVENAGTRNTYIASGSGTFFYTFLCLNATDLAVYDNSALVASSQYTVGGIGQPTGGTVVFTVPPTIGHTIVILSNASYTQPTDLVEGDGFYANTVETIGDRTTILTKQLKEITDRAPLFDEFSCDSGVRIDHPTAGFFLIWDGTGTRIGSAQAVTVGGALAIPVLTAGSIIFATGAAAVSQDNANLFWDDLNNRLGLGTNTPAFGLDAQGSGATIALPPGLQTNLINHFFRPTASGTDQQVSLASYIRSVAIGGATAGRIAGYFGAETGGGAGAGTGNPIWGINIVLQQNPADTEAQMIGLEVGLNNDKNDYLVYGHTPANVGISSVSSGSKIGGYAFSVGGAPRWLVGLQIPQAGIASGGWAIRYDGNGVSGQVTVSEDSVVTADRFTTNTLSGTPAANSIYQQSAARAWVVFDGTATNQITPIQSFNVKSPGIFRTATGVYNITWDRPFTCSRYAVVPSILHSSDASAITSVLTTTCATVTTFDSASNPLNATLVFVAAYGPQ